MYDINKFTEYTWSRLKNSFLLMGERSRKLVSHLWSKSNWKISHFHNRLNIASPLAYIFPLSLHEPSGTRTETSPWGNFSSCADNSDVRTMIPFPTNSTTTSSQLPWWYLWLEEYLPLHGSWLIILLAQLFPKWSVYRRGTNEYFLKLMIAKVTD